MGRFKFIRIILSSIFVHTKPVIEQSLFDIKFKSPIGLAAGFDYEARLTEILPSLGFGFETVGTLTRCAYDGNSDPMLGRLSRSQSLMVNKGFKNLGIRATLEKLTSKQVMYPIGISIGKTNNINIKTQEGAVEDIIETFREAERFRIDFTYYELNISCPNLIGNVEFYNPDHLNQLLQSLSRMTLSRPVFIKMPISKTDEEIDSMMDVIIQYPLIEAVIIGNLQQNRNSQSLYPDEVAKFNKGSFSGIPCQKRSDELIRRIYKKHGSAIKIIGCGGIFNTADAYRKIRLGASLVQLITGLIFEGPQLVSDINKGLVKLLYADGYNSISDAIGVDA
ncbi:MAG: dihydroorotate dehydrogenase 2, nonfunctional [Parcubacteria group bacterium GW2011_GWC1_39_29]|uniref:Dihydroorotate dehydrogenase (quinone) n=1 Tax=Candidatus Yanofskybacteria bacterium GW2011_GWD1_39_16 TaxID=1619030 RepID=A0A837HSQ1_9BACT|nr:MAG: dihydroorotate dehydrogenase 2, nonfunctional [Candidatus Yanofskybacteria bacterium GW2011_GWD1_39_16]KKR15031.1 MAG: dihydroorotate dehydrogenase 2, nonfunctional [Parcubacteria group bacterium GW2011_GWC1_39_29]